MQDYYAELCKLFSTPRRPSAKGGGFNRYAHSAVPYLDVWMIGCQDVPMKDWGLRIGIACWALAIGRWGLEVESSETLQKIDKNQ